MEADNEIIHVFPQFGKQHATDGDPCWCHPETECLDNGNKIVVHNAEQ